MASGHAGAGIAPGDAADDRHGGHQRDGDAGKERRRRAEPVVAPGAIVQDAAGREPVAPGGGVHHHVIERAAEPLLRVRQPVGIEERGEQHAGERASHGQRAELRRPPDLRAHGDGRGHRDGRHHQQVVRRQRLQHAHRGEQQAPAPARLAQQQVQSEQGDRQVLDVQRLQVAESHQRVRVERIGEAGHHAGGAIAGPSRNHPRHRQSAQREASDHQQVVDQHRIEAGPGERRSHQRLRQHHLRERQRARFGIEDVGVEQAQRGGRKRHADPRHDPRVQRRVGIVDAAHRARCARQRPGVEHGGQREER